MDLFGPPEIKDMVKQRTRRKVWGVIFDCAATRAVYLDLTEDYGTSSILHTIRRFIPKKLLLSAMLGVVSRVVRKPLLLCLGESVVVECMLICMHSAYQMDRKGMQWNRPHYYR